MGCSRWWLETVRRTERGRQSIRGLLGCGDLRTCLDRNSRALSGEGTGEAPGAVAAVGGAGLNLGLATELAAQCFLLGGFPSAGRPRARLPLAPVSCCVELSEPCAPGRQQTPCCLGRRPPPVHVAGAGIREPSG